MGSRSAGAHAREDSIGCKCFAESRPAPPLSGMVRSGPRRLIRPQFCVKSRTCVNGCASAWSAARRSPQNPPISPLLLPCSRRISRRNSRLVQPPTPGTLKLRSPLHLLLRSLDRFAERVPALKNSRPSISRLKINRRPKPLKSPLRYTLQTPAVAGADAAAGDAVAAVASRRWLKPLHPPQ